MVWLLKKNSVEQRTGNTSTLYQINSQFRFSIIFHISSWRRYEWTVHDQSNTVQLQQDPSRSHHSYPAPQSSMSWPGRGPRGGNPGRSLGRCSRTRGGWDWASGFVSTLGWNRRAAIIQYRLLKKRPSKKQNQKATQDIGKWHAENELWKIHIQVNVLGNTFFHLYKFLCTNPGLQWSITLLKGSKQTSLSQNISPKHIWHLLSTCDQALRPLRDSQISQPNWNRSDTASSCQAHTSWAGRYLKMDTERWTTVCISEGLSLECRKMIKETTKRKKREKNKRNKKSTLWSTVRIYDAIWPLDSN